MMKSEFEKRIGLTIIQKEYDSIEQAYLGMPESVDKDKFAKIWLKEGGIQGLFDARLAHIFRAKEKIKELEEEIAELENRNESLAKEKLDLAYEVMGMKQERKKILELVTDKESA